MRAVQGAVGRGQRRAESLMVDACTVRPVAGVVTNPDGTVSTTYGDPSYTGKCKLQYQRLRYPIQPESGGHVFTTGPLELHLPITAAVSTGEICEVTKSVDPQLVGKRYRIRIDARKTFATALRILLDEAVD